MSFIVRQWMMQWSTYLQQPQLYLRHEGRGSLEQFSTSRGLLALSSMNLQQLSCEGRGLLGQSSNFSSNLKVSLVQSSMYLQQLLRKGRGSPPQPSTYLQHLVMRGGVYFNNPRYFSSNLKGLTCAIIHLH